MIKAMSDAEPPSLPCTAHTLQLVVHEGLLSQRSVADAVAVGRRIVGLGILNILLWPTPASRTFN